MSAKPFPPAARERILRALVSSGLRVALLHGGTGRDLDLLVAPFDQAAEVLATIPGFTLVQAIRHGLAAMTCVLRHDGAWLPVDVVGEVRFGGVLYLAGKDVLERAVPWGPALAPSPADDFAAYLAKRLAKGEIGPDAAASLRRSLGEDGPGCRQALDRLLPEPARTRALRAIESGVDSEVRSLRRAMLIHGLRTRWTTIRPFGEAARILARVGRPTGFVVAVLGPDGAGKSTLIEGLARAFDRAFWRSARRHLRPQVLRRGGSPGRPQHDRPPRGVAASALQAALWLADYWIGHLLGVLPARIRTTLVLFDRYADDLAIDPRRFRFGGPAWLARAVAKLAPRPDVTLVLAGEAGAIAARKREVSEAELRRQLGAYAALAEVRTDAVAIDAGRPPEAILAAATEAIVSRLARRTARRLGLDR